jgi:DNA-directed RNA polymerase subunit RPC12/RpoP
MSKEHACVRCGDGYSFTNVYKGNYCPECHDWWLEHQRTGTDRRRPRVGRRPRRTYEKESQSRHGTDADVETEKERRHGPR